MKHLIKNKDGSVAIMVTNSPDVDPAAEVEKWETDMKDKYEGHRELLDEEIPDYYFQDAFSHKDDVLMIDMPKAREVHKNKLRQLREPLMRTLDFVYNEALSKRDERAQLDAIAKKDQLRQVTDAPEIANAQTPEELKSFLPDFLL